MTTPIPFDKGQFLFGNNIRFLRDPLGLFRQLQQQYSAQRLVSIRLGGRVLTLVLKPEETRYILQENNRNYSRGRSYKLLREFLGDGLLTSDGDFWRRQRRLAQPAFHKQKLTNLAEIMIDESTRWTNRLAASDRSQPIDITDALMDVTLRIVTKTLFGAGLGEQLTGLSRALNNLNHIASRTVLNPIKLPAWLPTIDNRAKIKAARQVDELILTIIQARRQSGEQRDDLLDMLLRATDDETGEGMSDQQLRDEMVTLFTAGHETTATSMAWTLHLLAHHPDVQNRARQEIEQILAGRAQLTADDLRALPYLSQVVSESLRLYPPAWAMSRLSIGPDQLGNYTIEPEQGVLLSPYLLHHDPETWPNPEQFDPERFAAGQRESRHPYAFLPFGGGPRLCIGNQFALLEMQALLAGLLLRFRVEPMDNQPVRPQPLITLRPGRSIRLWFR